MKSKDPFALGGGVQPVSASVVLLSSSPWLEARCSTKWWYFCCVFPFLPKLRFALLFNLTSVQIWLSLDSLSWTN